MAKIVEMGFTAEQAGMALRQNNGNVQQAIDALLNPRFTSRGPQRDSRDFHTRDSRDSRDSRDTQSRDNRGPPPDRDQGRDRPERGQLNN